MPYTSISKAYVTALVSLLINLPAFSQSSTDSSEPPEKPASTIEVKPGPPVLKEKDLWNETGYAHPFVRMPKYILQDQKAIWTSPFHTAKEDAKWWAIFGVGTAALIATDKHTVSQFPNSSTQ